MGREYSLDSNLSFEANKTKNYTYSISMNNEVDFRTMSWLINDQTVKKITDINEIITNNGDTISTTDNIFGTPANNARNSTATTTKTFEDDGGQYSLAYIFSNYNVFVSGDYTNQQHIVGSIAVGGNVTQVIGLGGISTTDYQTNPYRNTAPWLMTLGGSLVVIGGYGLFYFKKKKQK